VTAEPKPGDDRNWKWVRSNPRFQPKKTAPAVVILTDGSVISGKLFINDNSRITDLLNDDRKFVPLQTGDGSIVALAKSSIMQVTLPSAEPAPYVGRDPYRILGLQPGAAMEEVKRAYHELCKKNHPDAIKSLGLSPEYQDLATRNMARINDAYNQIRSSVAAESENPAE
jgi:hypothetical protein